MACPLKYVHLKLFDELSYEAESIIPQDKGKVNGVKKPSPFGNSR